MLDEQVSSAILIESISMKRFSSGGSGGTFYNFSVYMGYTNLDQLGMTFTDNYLPDTKTMVFSASPYTFTVGPDEWLETEFTTPFYYDPAQGNLLFELMWSSESSGSVYMWHWTAGANRAIVGAYGSPTANFGDTTLPHILLNGDLGLDSGTFGSIKADFQ